MRQRRTSEPGAGCRVRRMARSAERANARSRGHERAPHEKLRAARTSYGWPLSGRRGRRGWQRGWGRQPWPSRLQRCRSGRWRRRRRYLREGGRVISGSDTLGWRAGLVWFEHQGAHLWPPKRPPGDAKSGRPGLRMTEARPATLRALSCARMASQSTVLRLFELHIRHAEHT